MFVSEIFAHYSYILSDSVGVIWKIEGKSKVSMHKTTVLNFVLGKQQKVQILYL
jgi:hypothetical protein